MLIRAGFVSLRQHYNDRREELGTDSPCPNEPEFLAYMLIFDLANKSISIPTAELPELILDHPLIRLAFKFRRAAQRNFDSQKEGSKLNAEFGLNAITEYTRLLRRPDVPFLIASLAEVRLREMRRSALRALTRTYPRLREGHAIRLDDAGQVVERRMVLIQDLVQILGCERQEQEASAWDDVESTSKDPRDEAVTVVKQFELQLHEENGQVVGAMINLGAWFNGECARPLKQHSPVRIGMLRCLDNRDGPYTRRWASNTAKRANISFVDIVNGASGTQTASDTTFTARQAVSSMKSAFKFAPPTKAQSPPAKPFAFPLSANAPPFQPSTNPTASIAFSFPTPTRRPISPPAPQPIPTPQTPPDPPTISFTIPTPSPPISRRAFDQPSLLAIAPRPSPPALESRSPELPAAANRNAASEPTQPHNQSTTPKPLALSESRHVYESQSHAPALGDVLITEIIEGLVDSEESEIMKIFRQRQAAAAYAHRLETRSKQLSTWASDLFSHMLNGEIKAIGEAAVLKEVGTRYTSRKVIKSWSHRAKEDRILRVEVNNHRKDVVTLLSAMGLGVEPSLDEEGGSPVGHRMEEEQVDHSLREVGLGSTTIPTRADLQAERAKDNFFTPSSFLKSIAHHITAHLQDDVNRWSVFISTVEGAQDEGEQEARQWLLDKFSANDDYEWEGVSFPTKAIGRYDDPEDDEDLGLVVFEVPPKRYGSREHECVVQHSRADQKAHGRCPRSDTNRRPTGAGSIGSIRLKPTVHHVGRRSLAGSGRPIRS